LIGEDYLTRSAQVDQPSRPPVTRRSWLWEAIVRSPDSGVPRERSRIPTLHQTLRSVSPKRPCLLRREKKEQTHSSSSSESNPNLPTRPSSSSLAPPSPPPIVETLPYPPGAPPSRPHPLPTPCFRRKRLGIDGREMDGREGIDGSWAVPRRWSIKRL
jgi:hypothetical protein